MIKTITPTLNQTGDNMSDQTPTNQSQTPVPTPEKTPMKITQSTTLKQLIELGLFKSSQVDALNKRLNRKKSKSADQELQSRANSAVAMYIGKTYGLGFDNKFRKKPIEKALLASGVSRSMIDKAIKTLVSEGVLTNNSDLVNNQCHTRHWRVEKVEEESQVESTEESTSEV